MAVFTFDNMGSTGSASNNWNYSDRNKDDFALQIDGTVVEMKQVQETQFKTNAPLFWKNEGGRATKVTEDTGSPCLNFCIVIDTRQFGEKEWIFNPKTKKDNTLNPQTGLPKNPDGLSKASMAIQKALIAAGMDPKNLDQLGGLNVSIATKEPPEGFDYGPTSPRPFAIRINGKGDKPFRGCFPFGQSPKTAPLQVSQPAPSSLQRAMDEAQAAMDSSSMRQQGSLPQSEQPPVSVYANDVNSIYADDIPF